MSTHAQPGMLELRTVEPLALARQAVMEAAARHVLERRELLALVGVLFFGVAVRLILISQPFVDRWSGRQADVAMIARNFYRHGFNIFYPQIDWAGSAPGYVGTEFPLIPFLASCVYLVFGEHEWVGRSVSVLFFAVSVPFLYLLVRKVWNERSALFGVSLYTLSPLSIFSSRAFMPDMASLSLSIAALYLFAEWLDTEADARLFAASCAAASLAILVKLPAVIIGLPLAYMAARAYGARLLLRPRLWAWAGLCLVFPLGWYLHALAVSRAHFPHHMFGEGGVQIVGLAAYAEVIGRALTSSLTPLVSVAMLGGLFATSRSSADRVFHYWLAAIVLFLFAAGRGASWHAWYELPLVPVAAAFAGQACDAALNGLKRFVGWRVALVLGCLYVAGVAALAVFYVRPLYDPWAQPLMNAGREVGRIAPPDASAVFTEWDPTTVYYSGRKGWRLERDGVPWQVPRDTEEAVHAIDMLRERGAGYLVFTRYSGWWFSHYPGLWQHLDSHYWRVRETDEYTIFALLPRE